MDLIDSAARRSSSTGSIAINRSSNVDRYLHNHMDHPLTSEDLAGRFSTQILRPALQTIPQPFVKYKSEWKKRLLLQEGNLTVKTVAELTGYQEPGYFTRVFRRYHGVTPSSVLES